MEKKLYVITSYEIGKDGAPFALCDEHFDSWEPRHRLVWRVIAEKTTEPCNTCMSIESEQDSVAWNLSRALNDSRTERTALSLEKIAEIIKESLGEDTEFLIKRLQEN